jgi:glycosyltransferase involved in cell wall biosynthesis
LILLLFTSSYPYDFAAEHTFLQPEIHHLVERFDRVILAPRINRGQKLPLTPGVEVNDEYADFLQRSSRPDRMIRMAFSPRRLDQEIRTRPGILLHPAKLLKLILFSGRAEATRRWATSFLKTQHLDTQQCILYSYWLDHTATGLARVKNELPGPKVISRAHGYDIYEEYYYPYYWPYRHETLAALDAVFFASESGKNYFMDRYPEFKSRYETSHLGTQDPGFTSKPSADDVFRIVSCAHIVPVKRLDLLLDGIAAAARLRPAQTFDWVHFGDGTGRKSLERKMTRKFPANAQGQLLGDIPNPEIMQHYRDHPVDVFVNVSSTEGGAPVAVQEAISCGIPVVATSVGGNPEVISEKNGILLSPDPKPLEIATALLKIWDAPQLAARMRIESRRLWERSYNAKVNFRLFAERLQAIGER